MLNKWSEDRRLMKMNSIKKDRPKIKIGSAKCRAKFGERIVQVDEADDWMSFERGCVG